MLPLTLVETATRGVVALSALTPVNESLTQFVGLPMR
jgi:hypothetical protein